MSWAKAAAIFAVLAIAFQVHGTYAPYLWALAVLLAIGFVAPNLSVAPRTDFAPFWMRITPTRGLLVENGLVSEDELQTLEKTVPFTWRWGSLLASPRPPADRSQWSFLLHGLRFTVLKPDNFDQSGLVFWNDFGGFSTSAEHLCILEQTNQKAEDLPLGNFAARLFLTPVPDGISLRLRKNEDLGKEEYALHPGRELTVIPWAEFRGYGWWQNQKRMARIRDAKRKEYGWTPEDSRDRPDFAPNELAHRFFVVEWSYI
jgi:hypothetical protein